MEDLLTGVSPVALDTPCNDDNLMELALGLMDWQIVALFLKLDDSEMVGTKSILEWSAFDGDGDRCSFPLFFLSTWERGYWRNHATPHRSLPLAAPAWFWTVTVTVTVYVSTTSAPPLCVKYCIVMSPPSLHQSQIESSSHA